MKKFTLLLFMSLTALSMSAQVAQRELAGKYRLHAESKIVDPQFTNTVYAHDDFVFTMEEQEDGTFNLKTFFYHGMNSMFEPLEYSATAQFSASEQLLYVYPTEWMWDEYMGKFMDPYSHDPMLYFLVEKDANGKIQLKSTENSLGFYAQSYYQGSTSFVYAVDYPGVVQAEKLDTYASVKPENLPGEYTMYYYNPNGTQSKTKFSITANGPVLQLTGMWGDKDYHLIHLDADGKGFYIDLTRKEDAGYYVYYLGSNVGDCRIGFSYDAEGKLVADNYFSYSPDFKSWVDAFYAVAVRSENVDGINSVTEAQPARSAASFDMQGRRLENPAKGQLYIKDGKKVIRR